MSFLCLVFLFSVKCPFKIFDPFCKLRCEFFPNLCVQLIYPAQLRFFCGSVHAMSAARVRLPVCLCRNFFSEELCSLNACVPCLLFLSYELCDCGVSSGSQFVTFPFATSSNGVCCRKIPPFNRLRSFAVKQLMM